MKKLIVIHAILLVTFGGPAFGGQSPEKTSKTIGSVLREPLPPEELSLSESDTEYIVGGPTFAYHVRKTTGTISAIRVFRQGRAVVETTGPADILFDQRRLTAEENSARVSILNRGKDKIVLEVKGILHDPTKRGPEVNYTVLHTFFNDGVVVSEVQVTPRADLLVKKAVVYRLPAQGEFSHYIHKRRDRNGKFADRGVLPEAGKAVRLATLTSCLQIFSPTSALALFTDVGATHLSRSNLDTAVVEVAGKDGNQTNVSLAQYIIHVASGDKPYVLKAGEPFRFRVGIGVAPNRLPHPRMHNLRMFTWIGDAKHPYPTDEEIAEVARLGFTVFQMHRVGMPGHPRPPTGEIERVINKVHQFGMLFLWAEGADLMCVNLPGVRKMQAAGKWPLWQGFNYGGRYTASMDPYCDLVATCLASPNGLAEYRLECIDRMMDQLPVDGIYLDDNLAYANCTLWREHGHPRPVYDCLIELHEMNWRRRELMRRRCPHALLIGHCTKAMILPVICDFDVQLYGEGSSFGSMEDYWDYFASVGNLPAQGMIWPGDSESKRCSAGIGYNFDLLTGGGQFSQLDWRIYPKKFPYAKGVSSIERAYAKTYNLAQFYFGLYESKPCYFADSADLFNMTAPLTYATIYCNQVWDDWLIPIANMNPEALNTSLMIRRPQALGISPEKEYLLYDIHRRTAKTIAGNKLDQGFGDISVPGAQLRLFYLRERPADAPCHLWGGKRISETWNGKTRKLTFTVHGPAGLRDTLFLWTGKHHIKQVVVAGKQVPFSSDPAQGLANGEVTFTTDPLEIEVLWEEKGTRNR